MTKLDHAIPAPAQPDPGRDKPITENERAWIDFIRLISMDSDPSPTLRRVQSLRSLLSLD